ncbi:MAG: HAD family phosphatase [Nitrospinota bacterium]|jgi:beta-phosphoglucomutase-like phosphatase (HAD superfamily)|nr:HAD family phosphatase [Nitrospinota bacterium]MDP7581326.1 HAD family phosphatase [Nitrospinota bacterium]HJN03077.1 HAD family phosphatase [Nitrospinota bacterium]|tara:strand:- start:331 stop:1023 length:693 start_codon:yes stop_codon:yes gene_type:complete
MDKGRKLKKLIQSRRGIIFDFDGLLVDSEPFHYKAYNAVFQEYGHTINQDEYWIEFTSKGKGAQGEIDRHKLKGLDPNKIRKKKFIVYSEFCRNGDICFFPLAARLIHSAELAGYKLAIASGSRNEDIRTILDLNGYGNTFHLIMGKESAQKEKPAPDIFIKTAEILGIEPDKLVVLEDAEKGLKASKEAGIPCVIVRNKLNQNLEFQDADFVCENLEEVAEAIENSGHL